MTHRKCSGITHIKKGMSSHYQTRDGHLEKLQLNYISIISDDGAEFMASYTMGVDAGEHHRFPLRKNKKKLREGLLFDERLQTHQMPKHK